ncbi:MAG: RNA polymerase sigma-70 factor [Massilibacteroides sp.]|nr:RNA polymerase sigma-70 factor [Massilibacteroides sp.]
MLLKEQEFDSWFKSIYVSYYARMRRFARRYVIFEEDAENIVQDVFLDLFERKEMYHSPVNMLAILFTSVKNKCIDYLRKQSLKQRTAEEFKEEYAIALQMSLNSLEAFDSNMLSEEDIETILLKAIDALPEKCREIFMLSKLEGKKQKEIAQKLNISINTVETQMGIAYKKLREELKNYLPLLFFLLTL